MSTYRNPVARGGDFADPFVLRYDGRYYLYCTNPDARCWSSSNLIDWQLEGPTIEPDEFPGLVPFAPEVVYSDGAFYMYTSPSGHGHFVLRSESPTGPFRAITGNVGHAIDGNVFIDDDGSWYFYWAGEEGIWGCAMASPSEFGEPIFTGIHMNGWTEGPFVSKRDDIYHMTLTGNHYLSSGYRIDAAWSRDPLVDYCADPLNPVLISASGPVVGLGHSSSVRGPDLVSTYLAYHSLNSDASRDLGIDRQVWSGRSLQVLGPTTSALKPAAPDERSDWKAGGANNWNVLSGVVEVVDSVAVLSGDYARAMWNVDLGDVFTAELNLTGVGQGIMLNDRRVPLPDDLAEAELHCWRVVYDDNVRVSIDGRERMILAVGAVLRIGVSTQMAPVHISHVALSRTVAAAADRTARKPVPGRFWASLGEGIESVPAAGQPYDTMCLQPGDLVTYDLNVQTAGEYRAYVSGEFGEYDAIAVDVNGNNCDVAVEPGQFVATFHANAGDSRLTLRGIEGAPALDLITVAPVPNATAVSLVNEYIAGYDKRLVGKGTWDNCVVEATVVVEFGEGPSHADLLIRATQLANGGEGDDPRLGINFLLGYSVQFHSDRVLLARHSYDERIIASRPVQVNPSAAHRLRICSRGRAFSVELDGRHLFDVHDPLPFPAGSVGTRTSNAKLHVERLELTAGGQTPRDN